MFRLQIQIQTSDYRYGLNLCHMQMFINQSRNEWYSIRPLGQVRGHLSPLGVSQISMLSIMQDNITKVIHGILTKNHFPPFNWHNFYLVFVSFPRYTLPPHMKGTCASAYCRFYYFFFLLPVFDLIFSIEKFHYTSRVFRNLSDRTHRDRIFSYSLGGLAILESFINCSFHTVLGME